MISIIKRRILSIGICILVSVKPGSRLPSHSILKMKIWIFWFESNSWIYSYIVLNKNWKIYWFKQSFTGLGSDDQCSSWGLHILVGFLLFSFAYIDSIYICTYKILLYIRIYLLSSILARVIPNKTKPSLLCPKPRDAV